MKNDIKNLRTAMGLSQQQLGEAMDVSRQTIRRHGRTRGGDPARVEQRGAWLVEIARGEDGMPYSALGVAYVVFVLVLRRRARVVLPDDPLSLGRAADRSPGLRGIAIAADDGRRRRREAPRRRIKTIAKEPRMAFT